MEMVFIEVTDLDEFHYWIEEVGGLVVIAPTGGKPVFHHPSCQYASEDDFLARGDERYWWAKDWQAALKNLGAGTCKVCIRQVHGVPGH